jgi:hypothetical protein
MAPVFVTAGGQRIGPPRGSPMDVISIEFSPEFLEGAQQKRQASTRLPFLPIHPHSVAGTGPTTEPHVFPELGPWLIATRLDLMSMKGA